MEDVFNRLIDSAGVADGDRRAVLALLCSLRSRFPADTPARLFERARHEGAPIPPARCRHGVLHGECVDCDGTIGTRFYFTGRATHLHATPTCPALAGGLAARRPQGSHPDLIASVPRYDAFLDVRDPCHRCLADELERGAPPEAEAPPPPALRRLSRDAPPPVGERLVWGGYSGPVTEVSGDGALIRVGGFGLLVAWGEYVVAQSQSVP